MTFAIDTIPSQQSTAIARAKPVTELELDVDEVPCRVSSIISKHSGKFLCALTFSDDDDDDDWEGYVPIPEELFSTEIQEAWDGLVERQRGFSGSGSASSGSGSGSASSASTTMVLDRMSMTPFPETAIVENIVQVTQSLSASSAASSSASAASSSSRQDETLSFQRELRIEYEGTWYHGYVFVPRDDVSTLEAIAQARKEWANDLDFQREMVTAVPSVEVSEEEEEEEAKRGELKTFSFKEYPRVGRLANVTAEDVYGFDLDECEVSILAVRRQGTTRDVRFRCLLPGNRNCWYEGSLTGDLRLGRFVEIEEP